MIFRQTIYGQAVKILIPWWFPLSLPHRHSWKLLPNVNEYGCLYSYCSICGERKQSKTVRMSDAG